MSAEVIIVGAGPAGTFAAFQLRGRGALVLDVGHRAGESALGGNLYDLRKGRGADPARLFANPAVYTPGPHCDWVIDAQAMPFAGSSVRAFYAIDCFHHFGRPELFFKELERTLVPGGGCILIEPYHGPLARFLFRRLFDSEPFDPDQPGWTTPTTGAMSAANQALSYIVFARDRSLFEARHPDLKVVREFPLGSYLRYLVSGGLNFRPLLPDFFAPALRGGELILTPAKRLLALHHVIVLRKDGTDEETR